MSERTERTGIERREPEGGCGMEHVEDGAWVSFEGHLAALAKSDAFWEEAQLACVKAVNKERDRAETAERELAGLRERLTSDVLIEAAFKSLYPKAEPGATSAGRANDRTRFKALLSAALDAALLDTEAESAEEGP